MGGTAAPAPRSDRWRSKEALGEKPDRLGVYAVKYLAALFARPTSEVAKHAEYKMRCAFPTVLAKY